MTKTHRHRERRPVHDSYIPPPSQFGSGGFKAFASTAVLEREAVPEQEADPAAVEAFEPAQALVEPSFDELIRGHSGDERGARSDGAKDLSSPRRHRQRKHHRDTRNSKLATASLVVSLLGIITGAGFLAGTVMGYVALSRIGSAGWLRTNERHERRARNAIRIGYLGMLVLLSAAILAAAWWLMQMQMPTAPLLQTPLTDTTPGAQP